MAAAEFGSTDAASMGGKARASKLTKDELSAIARHAAEQRWGKAGAVTAKVPVATHGTPDHPLRIPGIPDIPCYVLDDKRRVLVQRGMMDALDMKQGTAGRGGGDRLAKFLATKSINDYVPSNLRDVIIEPIKFKVSGSIAYGYEATILADICGAVLDARRIGKLNYQQEHIAERCEMLLRGFAKVGIIALVDEATGYQYERPTRDLQEQLKKFLAESLVRYASGFPHDFIKHLCRLRNVELRPDMKLPPYFGHLTNNLVYRRIAPGLVKALKDRRAERGRPGNKLYQWTSEDHGYPALMLHLGTVVTLMKLNTDYDKFEAQINTIAPIYPDVPGLFDEPADWELPAK
jgi:hypothetical protein